jgi:hypothetical protein
MKAIIKRYEKQFRYTPSIFRLYNLYTEGSLNLSDNEENILLIEFEKYYHFKK